MARAEVQLSVGEHVVYFYDDESDLAEVAATHLGAALAQGGAAIGIVMPAHRPMFIEQLESAGIDVASAQRNKRLVMLDARQTLDSFLVDGTPDAELFREVVGAAVAELVDRSAPVHAYGEMVGLLWDDGDVSGTVALESLWNQLLTELPFSLLCGYSTAALGGTPHEAIVDVCATHGLVLSALPGPEQADAVRTFPAVLQSPQLARAFVGETLAGWGWDDVDRSAAVLVASELAVNAIRHANSPFKVALSRSGEHVRITVGDADPTAPKPQHSDSQATSGRGLLIVDRVATTWGCTPADRGKMVWAELSPSTGSGQ